jgi:hypothetical protein
MSTVVKSVIYYVHILIGVLLSFYAFLTKKNPVIDYLYILINVGIFLHWTYFNGECILTYYHKKLDNPNYKPGENVNLSEYSNNFYTKLSNIVLRIFKIIGFYIVAKRNNISMYLIIPFIFIHEIYNNIICITPNTYIDKNFQLFQEFVKISIYAIILGGFYNLYR